MLAVTGRRGPSIFEHEPGGHRWQRTPPNDKHGRIHTSTVTVSVMRCPTYEEFRVSDRKMKIDFSRGSGPGGQHRNKTESCVSIVDLETGITARVDGRAQGQNLHAAMMLIRARVVRHLEAHEKQRDNDHRRRQIGSGMRGDKRRTIRTRDGQVFDHVTGKRWKLKAYLNGEW